MWPIDIRNVLSAHAQALRMLCMHSEIILNDVWQSQLSAPFVTSEALSFALLEQQVNSLVDLIRQQGLWQVALILLATRMSITNDQGVSRLGINAFASLSEDDQAKISIIGYKTDDNICYCRPSVNCQAQATLYMESEVNLSSLGVYAVSTNMSISIKGMKTACFPVEGILASTLECYSNLSCIQFLVLGSTAEPLNATYPTRFPIINATVEDIFDNIMIEDWY